MRRVFGLIIIACICALVLIGAGCKRVAENAFPQDQERHPDEHILGVTDDDSGTEGNDTSADPTAGWETYVHDASGFSMKYPFTVDFMDSARKHWTHVGVRIDPVEGLEGTMGYDEETARKNMAALGRGEYGDSVDFSLPASEQVREIGDTHARDFLVLGRFEVCDVTFERKLYLFHDDYQIVVTVSGTDDAFAAAMPEYFTTDAMNCGDVPMWNHDLQNDFLERLRAGNAPDIVQEWYDAFDAIIATIALGDGAASSSSEAPALIEGRWRSVDDEFFITEFIDGEKRDYYNGKRAGGEAFYELHDDKLIVADAEGPFEYTVLKLTEDVLEMSYSPRGNTLKYVRE